MESIKKLMTAIIDYAGLFPPAKLNMSDAVQNYASYRESEYSWMLSRFICPVSRFGEFADSAEKLLPSAEEESPWQISAIGNMEKLDSQIDAMFDLMQQFPGRVLVDAVELKISAVDEVDAALNLLPAEIMPFFEFPLVGDIRGFIASLSGADAAAKIRTGGVTPDLVPDPADVARFLHLCRVADVPFKATAGLHHPLRNFDSNVGAEMFGFLNLFLAGLLAGKLSEQELVPLLTENDISNFTIDDEGISWHDHTVTTEQISRGREKRCLSYGSCSFTEPVEDLKAMNLI